MDTVKQQLDIYIKKSKKNSKLSQADCDEIVKLLISNVSTDDFKIWCNETVNVLNDTWRLVTDTFFKHNFFDALSDEQKKEFIYTLINSKKIASNASGFGEKRLKSAALILEKKKLNEDALLLHEASSKYSSIGIKKSVNKSYTNHKLESDADEQQITSISLPRQETEPKQKIFSIINSLQLEANKFVSENKNLKFDKDNLSSKIEVCEQRILDLQMQLAQQKQQFYLKESELSNCLSEISDLKERLKKSFQTDSINHNNELIALKTGLAKSLRLEYEDFKKLEAKPYSDEYYSALINITNDIFDTIKRKGIIIDIERD